MNITADTKRLMPELLQILGLPTEFEDFCFSVIRSHLFCFSIDWGNKGDGNTIMLQSCLNCLSSWCVKCTSLPKPCFVDKKDKKKRQALSNSQKRSN